MKKKRCQTFKPEIIPASLDDYPVIQNMAMYYVYDMSRYCGFQSDEWSFSKEGLMVSHDTKSYFEVPDREAYLVKVDDELAGFVLLNKINAYPETDWNMGEFFVIAKYQRKGIAREVAKQIWHKHPGNWEVSAFPDNERALLFWRRVIGEVTRGEFKEELHTVDYGKGEQERCFFRFSLG